MALPRPTRAHLPYLSLAARLLLGGVLLASGLSKVTALEVSAEATRAYQLLPYEAANTVGYLLPLGELALGALLLLGLFTRWAGLLSALLMVAFTAAIASVWARGISIDCGCFGGGGSLDRATAVARYPWDMARDAALAACGLLLAWRPTTPGALDRWLER